MEKKVTAIIERGNDNKYSIYIEDKEYPYGVIGVGDTVKDAMQDFLDGYQEMKEYALSIGNSFEEVAFIFKYDVPSFLQDFAYAFSLAGLERIIGNLLRRPSARSHLEFTHSVSNWNQFVSFKYAQ